MVEVTNGHDPDDPRDWCAWCGTPLPLDDRWGIRRYCGYRCRRDSEYLDARRDTLMAGRACRQCGEPIPETQQVNTNFCSVACRHAYFHTPERIKARRERRKRRQRAGRTCDECGGSIPMERTLRARFCSIRCKSAERNRRKRAAQEARQT